ncbi:MAG: right-handed parallel beta-helix repeat-containing protein, partial [Bacteroidota bacterium]
MNTRHGIPDTLVLLGLLIFAPTFASAATYFITPSGSDSNSGTQASPFATIQKAHDVAVAGDTIYLRGGIYNLNSLGQTVLTRDGSSGNHIKLFNYPGELPVLDGISVTNQFLYPLFMNSASWWHIKGLEIKNGPFVSIEIAGDSSNNIIEGNNIHHGGRLAVVGSGIRVTGAAAHNLFLNNDFHHQRDTTGGSNADGISLSGVSGSGNVLRGNRSWRNGDDGFDLWNSVAVTMENNWAWENGFDDALNPLGDGNGFKLGGSGSGDGGHTLRNNVAWKNKARGFDQNAADIGITLYNNTGWSNPWGNYQFPTGSHVYTNNISFEPGGADNRSGTSTTNNWQVGTTTSADFVTLAWTANTGARQADGSLPVSTFLHLVSGSDLIDKGVDVGIAYSGNAPELGAYEYVGSVPPPPAPPPPPPP